MSQLFASDWLSRLERPDEYTISILQACYGNDPQLLAERVTLVHQVISTFISRYGDAPLRVFRAPGRINLRGMHVDTHGGYLNLMTHHREVIIAIRPCDTPGYVFNNIDPQYSEVVIKPDAKCSDHASDSWGNYIEGVLKALHIKFPNAIPSGCQACIGSDIPPGASLSSSHALCVAILEALCALSSQRLSPKDKILATRAAEWHTGARTGISDQTPMFLAQREHFLHAALLAEDLDLSHIRQIPFPNTLRILVIDSCTQRKLSGPAYVAYAKNRFAYSAALDLFNAVSNHDPVDRFSHIIPERFGGDGALLTLLKRVPLTAQKSELLFNEHLAKSYTQFFGHLDSVQQPTEFNVRGPLLFGLAESERARQFPIHLELQHYSQLGALLTTGHNGDRILDELGNAYHYPVDSAKLDTLIDSSTSLAAIPGAYGASSPALDGIVDAALKAGALGACLTGAGIAGSVIALCTNEQSENICEALISYLASPEFARRRNAQQLSPKEAYSAVTFNHSTVAAGELQIT